MDFKLSINLDVRVNSFYATYGVTDRRAGCLGFAEKALTKVILPCDRRAHDLHRHTSAEDRIGCSVNDAHGAFADELDYMVFANFCGADGRTCGGLLQKAVKSESGGKENLSRVTGLVRLFHGYRKTIGPSRLVSRESPKAPVTARNG